MLLLHGGGVKVNALDMVEIDTKEAYLGVCFNIGPSSQAQALGCIVRVGYQEVKLEYNRGDVIIGDGIF
jgi:hypothetical protein